MRRAGARDRSQLVATGHRLGLSDDPAEGTKNGLNQLEIQRKDIMKILSIELESVNRINSLNGMNRGVKIKSRHRPKDLFFAYLTHRLSVSFDRHAAL